CRQENFVWKDFKKQLSAFESHLVMTRPQSKAGEPRASQHDGVPIIVGQFAQTRWNVSPKIDNVEICAFPEQLAFPSHTSCGYGGAPRQRSATARMFRDQYIIHRCTRKNRSNFCLRVRFARKIFCAVDRDVDTAAKKG